MCDCRRHPDEYDRGRLSGLKHDRLCHTSSQVGDAAHVKVFANQDGAETWFAENDPEGVAFEYEVLE